jgi:hypothetical protein
MVFGRCSSIALIKNYSDSTLDQNAGGGRMNCAELARKIVAHSSAGVARAVANRIGAAATVEVLNPECAAEQTEQE